MTLAVQKVRARHALNHAIEKGRLVSRPCEKCGAQKAQGHHHDYTKPLDVEWLCAKCHSQHHNQKHPLTSVCEICEKQFTPTPTKRGRAKVCSWKCRSVLLSKKLTANPSIPPWAKLSKEIADQIRARAAAEKISQRALGREFGVHHSQIGSILRGEAWK